MSLNRTDIVKIGAMIVNFKILNEASTIFEQLENIMLVLKLMGSVYYHIPSEDSNVLKAILTGNIRFERIKSYSDRKMSPRSESFNKEIV